MSKALCILKSDLFGVDTPAPSSGILGDEMVKKLMSLPCTVHPRKNEDGVLGCESTFSPYLQIIPYVTIRDYETGKYFVYTRGTGGGESKLHGKCSIGLGGHMEICPTPDQTLIDCMVIETVRELVEEIGLSSPDEAAVTIRRLLESNHFHLMYNTATEVDRLHLAVAFPLTVSADDLKTMEEGVITRGRWLTYGQIKEATSYAGGFELETWSRMVMDVIGEQLKDQSAATVRVVDSEDQATIVMASI